MTSDAGLKALEARILGEVAKAFRAGKRGYSNFDCEAAASSIDLAIATLKEAPTFNFFCAAFGEAVTNHVSCPSVIVSPDQIAWCDAKPLADVYPIICGCECRTCKRAYFKAGSPIRQPDGSVKRKQPIAWGSD